MFNFALCLLFSNTLLILLVSTGLLTTVITATLTMMTPSNGNIFRVTVSLCEEFTGHRWILLTKAADAELWCFLWSAPWINDWVNNSEAGDLRRHRAHYDIIVMHRYTFDTVELILSIWLRFGPMGVTRPCHFSLHLVLIYKDWIC